MKTNVEHVYDKEDIKLQLELLGIKKGMVVYVESDYKEFSYISGGVQTLLDALMETVGYEGTIVMGTYTYDLLDPCMNEDYEINREYYVAIRNDMKAFDKKLSKPYKMDIVNEQLLRNEGVARSYHPYVSFCAWGKYAKIICEKHPLHFGLSNESPLGKLLEFNGYCILLGRSFKECEIFHLAQYNSNNLSVVLKKAPISEKNLIVWKTMLDLELNHEGFDEIGEMMLERGVVKTASIGEAKLKLFSCREAVKLGTAYINAANYIRD
ncbi:MAG: AAC(3) family N-acetyltransferase [Erysipelotrichaceae bacterium]